MTADLELWSERAPKKLSTTGQRRRKGTPMGYSEWRKCTFPVVFSLSSTAVSQQTYSSSGNNWTGTKAPGERTPLWPEALASKVWGKPHCFLQSCILCLRGQRQLPSCKVLGRAGELKPWLSSQRTWKEGPWEPESAAESVRKGRLQKSTL